MPYNTNACKLKVHNTFLAGGADSDFSTSSLKPTSILGSGPLDSLKKEMEKEGEEGWEKEQGGEGWGRRRWYGMRRMREEQRR